MICSKCKTNNASFFYTQSINGKESSLALCQSCAQKADIGTSMVPPLFSTFITKNQASKNASAKKCRLCALTFSDLLSMGKVGCPECYNTFKEELSDTIRSIHGTAKHSGSSQITTVKEDEFDAASPSEEEILRKELNEAIQSENYEKAAVLRDKIKALKGEVQ